MYVFILQVCYHNTSTSRLCMTVLYRLPFSHSVCFNGCRGAVLRFITDSVHLFHLRHIYRVHLYFSVNPIHYSVQIVLVFADNFCVLIIYKIRSQFFVPRWYFCRFHDLVFLTTLIFDLLRKHQKSELPPTRSIWKWQIYLT